MTGRWVRLPAILADGRCSECKRIPDRERGLCGCTTPKGGKKASFNTNGYTEGGNDAAD